MGRRLPPRAIGRLKLAGARCPPKSSGATMTTEGARGRLSGLTMRASADGPSFGRTRACHARGRSRRGGGCAAHLTPRTGVARGGPRGWMVSVTAHISSDRHELCFMHIRVAIFNRGLASARRVVASCSAVRPETPRLPTGDVAAVRPVASTRKFGAAASSFSQVVGPLIAGSRKTQVAVLVL